MLDADLKEKLKNLNANSSLSHIQKVTHKFVQPLDFKNTIKNKTKLKEKLLKGVKQTEFIHLNGQKMPIISHKPFISKTLYFCQNCLELCLDLINLKAHEGKCNEEIGLLSYKEECEDMEINEFFKSLQLNTNQLSNQNNKISNQNEKVFIEIFQIDGSVFSKYSHALTKLGKYFFNDKSLDSLLEYFYLFVLKIDKKIVGYFSMDKLFKDCNISCIVIFPPYRKLKLGYLLIDFSYKIFQLRGLTASPERPFSPAGAAVFKKYWKYKITEFLQSDFINSNNQIDDRFNNLNDEKIDEISKKTGIMADDIKECLEDIFNIKVNYKLRCLKNKEIKILIPEKYENN